MSLDVMFSGILLDSVRCQWGFDGEFCVAPSGDPIVFYEFMWRFDAGAIVISITMKMDSISYIPDFCLDCIRVSLRALKSSRGFDRTFKKHQKRRQLHAVNSWYAWVSFPMFWRLALRKHSQYSKSNK